MPPKGPARRDDDSGAGSRIRTRDPLITNQVLYQLSYAGAGDGVPAGRGTDKGWR